MQTTSSGREPVFNAPTIVIVLVAIMLAVHVGRSLVDDDLEYWLVVAMAFIPGRYGVEGGELPGAPWAALTSLVTHTLVHGDFLHLFVNAAWLLAVGSPLARRLTLLSFSPSRSCAALAGRCCSRSSTRAAWCR